MCKTLHEAVSNRIGASNEYDGYRAGRLLHRPHRRAAVGQDHVRSQCQQLRGGGSNPFIVADAPMVIDLKIVTDFPAPLLESLPERQGADTSLRIALGIEHQHT